MQYRVEKKYICTEQELQILQTRLSALMNYDKNQVTDRYLIRSMYFDTYDNRFFHENEAGIDNRKKYRIRTYNCEAGNIRLEIKSKLHGYTHKDQCTISKELYEQLSRGQLPKYEKSFEQPMQAFFLEMAQHMLKPVIIIEYERTAFVSEIGNVRITFDRNISASREMTHFFDKNLRKMPLMSGGHHILEVKYDELIPDYINQVLELGRLEQTTFSKYYIARQMIGDF